jgi:2-methylcitrate dehydratase PrpD
MNTQSPTEATTAALVKLLARPVTDQDRQRAALHVLDWVGCAAAGALTPPGVAMRAWARTLAAGPCRAIGGLSLDPRDAALVNGAVGNVLEMDDFHRAAIVHPGPVVIPTALAQAEASGADARALLDAIVRGMEAMIRVGTSVGPTHYRHFHTTATCGVFGAAAAAGSLLGLSEPQMADALGNAGTQAAGLWQCRLEDTMSKQLHNGRAAQSGLLAAQLARHGLTGAHRILEGPLGFWAGLCPDARPQALIAGPRGPWQIHDCSFKPWPACRHTHPLIDAALALRPKITIERIRSIRVFGYRDAITMCDHAQPTTPVETKFSLQHAAAVVLLRGEPGLDDFDMGAVRSPDVAALRRRVELTEDDALTARYPAHFGARLDITFDDGSRLTEHRSDALGDTENPLSHGQLVGKARMLMQAAGYSPERMDQLTEACLALADGGPIRAISSQLQ